MKPVKPLEKDANLLMNDGASFSMHYDVRVEKHSHRSHV
jgi:hypothetical protein